MTIDGDSLWVSIYNVIISEIKSKQAVYKLGDCKWFEFAGTRFSKSKTAVIIYIHT